MSVTLVSCKCHSLFPEPLPPDVQSTVVPLFHNNEPFIKSFLTDLIPDYDHHTIEDSLRKVEMKVCDLPPVVFHSLISVFFLQNFALVNLGRKRRKRKPRASKGSLSLTERRRLGLYQLRRHGSKYSDAIPVHELWQQYISGLLALDSIEESG